MDPITSSVFLERVVSSLDVLSHLQIRYFGSKAVKGEIGYAESRYCQISTLKIDKIAAMLLQ